MKFNYYYFKVLSLIDTSRYGNVLTLYTVLLNNLFPHFVVSTNNTMWGCQRKGNEFLWLISTTNLLLVNLYLRYINRSLSGSKLRLQSLGLRSITHSVMTYCLIEEYKKGDQSHDFHSNKWLKLYLLTYYYYSIYIFWLAPFDKLWHITGPGVSLLLKTKVCMYIWFFWGKNRTSLVTDIARFLTINIRYTVNLGRSSVSSQACPWIVIQCMVYL